MHSTKDFFEGTMDSTFTEAGAKALCEKIRKYWVSQGHPNVTVEPVVISMGGKKVSKHQVWHIWGIRSNIGLSGPENRMRTA